MKKLYEILAKPRFMQLSIGETIPLLGLLVFICYVWYTAWVWQKAEDKLVRRAVFYNCVAISHIASDVAATDQEMTSHPAILRNPKETEARTRRIKADREDVLSYKQDCDSLSPSR